MSSEDSIKDDVLKQLGDQIKAVRYHISIFHPKTILYVNIHSILRWQTVSCDLRYHKSLTLTDQNACPSN